MIEREIARDIHEHTLAQSEGSSGWSEAYASQSEANIKVLDTTNDSFVELLTETSRFES